MKKIQINELFTNYLNDREKGLEPLLEAIRRKALLKFKDEDVTQDFLIEMWTFLAELPEDEDRTGKPSFLALLNQILLWRYIALKAQTPIEEQLPEIPGVNGEPISTQDTIDLLQFKEVSWQELGRGRRIEDVGYKKLDDEFLQEVADMLLTGKTQDQVAAALGIDREVLHRKILRHIKKEKKTPTDRFWHFFYANYM